MGGRFAASFVAAVFKIIQEHSVIAPPLPCVNAQRRCIRRRTTGMKALEIGARLSQS
jgi:hypothetical protein